MVTDRKPTGRASGFPAGLAAGAAANLGVTIAGAALLAKLISAEGIPESWSGYCVMVLLILSAWLGALIAKTKIKRQKLLVCLASGGVYFGMLLMMTALFFGGQYSGVGETALLIFCGAVLGLFTGTGGKRRRKSRKIKR